jgi:opacity protein-like surface antigen
MRKILIVGAAIASLAALALPAKAQTSMPTKASVTSANSNPCTPTTCIGLYLGGGLDGNGTNADIIANGINNSVFGGGMIPKIDLGYQYASGNWFFAGEADFGYQLGTTSTVNGVGANQNGPLFMQIFKVGGNLNSLLGIQNPINIPASIASVVISPYAFVGPAEHFFGGSSMVTGTASGAGITFDLTKNWFGDIRYTNIQYGASSNGAFNFNSQNIVGFTLNYKFNSAKSIF